MKREGFWRHKKKENSEFPWPKPCTSERWIEEDKSEFMHKLAAIEGYTYKQHSKGWSNCRICKCKNGSATHQVGGWEWPSGFRHYIARHNLKPTLEFRQFIRYAYNIVRRHEKTKYLLEKGGFRI